MILPYICEVTGGLLNGQTSPIFFFTRVTKHMAVSHLNEKASKN